MFFRQMGFRARAEQVYLENTKVLKGIGLLRPVWLLTAVCAPGIGAAAITLAFAGMSTVPLLCLAISIPAFAWGGPVRPEQTDHLRRVDRLCCVLRFGNHCRCVCSHADRYRFP